MWRKFSPEKLETSHFMFFEPQYLDAVVFVMGKASGLKNLCLGKPQSSVFWDPAELGVPRENRLVKWERKSVAVVKLVSKL